MVRDFKWVTGESFEKMRFQKKNHIDFFSKSGKKKISKLSYTLRSIYKREVISENNFRDLDLSENRSLCTSVRLAYTRLNRLKHDTFSSLPADWC